MGTVNYTYNDCDEFPSVFEELTPIARKEHRCYECKATIYKGSMYHKYKGCWDGKWARYKRCDRCVELAHQVARETGYMPSFGDVIEHAQEAGIIPFDGDDE